MEKKRRKWLSLLMCMLVAISMTFGSLSAVFAEDESAGITEVTEDEALSALGEECSIMEEPEDSYSSEDASMALVDGNTVEATTTEESYVLTTSGDLNTTTTFKIVVPCKGYLSLQMFDNSSYDYNIYFKTKGFKDEEYLTTSDTRRYIGVTKGTYTISLRSYASSITVNLKMCKVKEGKFGTKKSKASKLKKKSARKGVIITNSKKTHWYKIVNPKNQKLKLVVNAKKMNGGGYYGGLKVSVVYPNKNVRYSILDAGYSTEYSITYGKYGTTKARKGTYYVKVQSYNGGNGYFVLKWK